MHLKIIKKSLQKNTSNVFDDILEGIEDYFNRSVSSLEDLKNRENKKLKGDVWELFCKDWLLFSNKYKNVWLLSEYNKEYANILPKQDNGIDLIAQTKTGYEAIQCKYRGKKSKVNWKTLSTFIALCERTGPWDKYVVMTNCSGVTRKLPKSPKDKSICIQSFRNTKRDHWLRMIGHDNYNTISHCKPKKKLTLEELRKKRCEYYDTNNSSSINSC